MSDLQLASQLQQWTFDKSTPTDRPGSSTSSSTSPKLSDEHPYTLRIDTSVASHSIPASRKESVVLQERYLSSEENLSSLDDISSSEYESDFDYDDDDVSIHDGVQSQARKMSISKWDKGRSCDVAVAVSYSFAGRPKVVELAHDHAFPPHSHPIRQQRAASLAMPNAAISKLRKLEQAQRFSMVLPSSKALSSTRSASPASSEALPRPSTSTVGSRLDLTSPTASSPALSFLSSDPYENSENSPASPMNKKASPHRRLRSISMKLALAKITISPSKKPADSRAPLTPFAPATPATPRTPSETTSALSSPKLRRASFMRPKSRHSELVSTPLSPPPVPTIPANKMIRPQSGKLVARGADEREPTLIIPDFPVDAEDEPVATKSKSKLRRRKSMMDLF